MSIFRVTRDSENPYVMINKQFIYDKQLSFKAKGILAYVLSRPDDWQIYEIEVIKHSKDGRDSVRTGIKELVEKGYVVRHEKRNDLGRFEGYDYEVFEIPRRVYPETENPTSGNPTSENPTLLSNECTNELNNVVVENAFSFYQQNFGVMNPFIMSSINAWINDIGESLVIEAMKRSLKQQKKWNYAEGILRDWHNRNLRTVEDVETSEKQFKNKNQKQPKRQHQKEDESVLAGMWNE